MNTLLDKKIVSVKIADDKMAMLFVTENNENLILRVDADCCSHTWIESVDLPALGLPFTVIECKDLELNIPEKEYDGDVIKFYGAEIVTDKGSMNIDYRNSSNGYYGGNIVWPDEEDNFYGGVFNQNESYCIWVDIE